MPIQPHEENGGKMFAVQVSGELAMADFQPFVRAFGGPFPKRAKPAFQVRRV